MPGGIHALTPPSNKQTKKSLTSALTYENEYFYDSPNAMISHFKGEEKEAHNLNKSLFLEKEKIRCYRGSLVSLDFNPCLFSLLFLFPPFSFLVIFPAPDR